ncbi:ATP-dependent DNA helicase PIF1-like protein [Tanacetum coccineum]
MTVNKKLYPTFKAACFAYGLLNDNKEWAHAIKEAAFWALAPQLRDLFVTMLLFCDVSRPLHLWEQTWELLSKDILRGTGKTFLYKTIISRLRSERQIVLAVASSGIDSIFLFYPLTGGGLHIVLRDVAVYYHFAISTFPVKIVIRSSAFIVEYLLQLPIRNHFIALTRRLDCT